jgi:hypothetical protein
MSNYSGVLESTRFGGLSPLQSFCNCAHNGAFLLPEGEGQDEGVYSERFRLTRIRRSPPQSFGRIRPPAETDQPLAEAGEGSHSMPGINSICNDFDFFSLGQT